MTQITLCYISGEQCFVWDRVFSPGNSQGPLQLAVYIGAERQS